MPWTKQPDFAAQAIKWLKDIETSFRDVSILDFRTVLLFAHADDETIGASAAMGRLPAPVVVYLTDSAPRDTRFQSSYVSGPREEYARIRREESNASLSLVNVTPDRIVRFNAVDQESIFEATALVERLAMLLQELNANLLITHAYEGGHPDHDAASLVAHLAVKRARRALGFTPGILEVALYRGGDGQRVFCEFIPSPAHGNARYSAVTLKLSEKELANKQNMVACYASQAYLLKDFPLEPEQLRIAPDYDFTEPPHDGPLWYEMLHWPLSGQQWRELAADTLAHFSGHSC